MFWITHVRRRNMHTAQRALLVYMRHLSDENWCAGWLIGLEFMLWDWVLRLRSGADHTLEFERASAPDIEVLSWLPGTGAGGGGWEGGAEEHGVVSPDEGGGG